MFEQLTAVYAPDNIELFSIEQISGKVYIWDYKTGEWKLYAEQA